MSEADLPASVAARLCGWVDAELNHFTPWHEAGTTRPSSLQRFAELAIAYDVIDRSPLQLPSVGIRWGPFIRRELSQPAFGELARSRLDWAWAILLPYLIMRGRGEVNHYHDATLRESRRAGFPRALEVVPYRALDYAYFAQLSGLTGRASGQAEALLARTYAARVSCRYSVNNESAYALTHAIFYASSFGQKQMAAGRLANAAPVVDSMIIECCVRRNYDLLGELLVASQVLAGTRVEVRRMGIDVFLSTLDESGCLRPNGDATDRTFEACYHTTMVGLILCASLASTGF